MTQSQHQTTLNVSPESDVSESPYMDRCLSFTIQGNWAHFRRVEGNIVKQTYRVMPRTTVAGLVAAMLGIGRDQYYDLFASDYAGIAISIESPSRTMNLPKTPLSTDWNKLEKTSGKPKAAAATNSGDRQVHGYEYLRDVEYRIDITFDGEPYSELKEMLENGETHYTPSLGKSECLAEIEYLGEYTITTEDTDEVVDVDSTIPGSPGAVVPSANESVITERSPSTMTVDDVNAGHRRTTEYVTHTVATDGSTIKARGVNAKTVDGRTVCFH